MHTLQMLPDAKDSLEQEFKRFVERTSEKKSPWTSTRLLTFALAVNKYSKQEVLSSAQENYKIVNAERDRKLSEVQRVELVLIAKRNDSYRDKYVRVYLKIPVNQALRIANLFPRLESYLPDLVQEGNIGLLSALEKFDGDKLDQGLSEFERYAWTCSKYSMFRYLRAFHYQNDEELSSSAPCWLHETNCPNGSCEMTHTDFGTFPISSNCLPGSDSCECTKYFRNSLIELVQPKLTAEQYSVIFQLTIRGLTIKDYGRLYNCKENKVKGLRDRAHKRLRDDRAFQTQISEWLDTRRQFSCKSNGCLFH